ncbi:MAG TPA: hypothetical protein VGI70_01270, partial [Polyangiales bacterium]
LLGLLVSAAIGCAGNIPQTHDIRAAGEWRFHLPQTRSALGDLAYGRGGNSTPAAISAADQSLLAENTLKQPASAPRAVHRAQHAAKQPEALPAIPEAVEPPAAAPTPSEQPVQLAQADQAEQRYQQRESASKPLEKYRGGDAIVIGAGTLVVVLLIVILVLLLR